RRPSGCPLCASSHPRIPSSRRLMPVVLDDELVADRVDDQLLQELIGRGIWRAHAREALPAIGARCKRKNDLVAVYFRQVGQCGNVFEPNELPTGPERGETLRDDELD